MVLKLYGNPMSTCTKRVAMVLKEKNVPFEFVVIDFAKSEHKSPAYLEKQPFGQVPYIDDDGFILFESRAIARYIAIKYHDQGATLLPAYGDLQGLGRFEQGASIEAGTFDVYAGAIAFEKLFKPMRGLQTDDTKLEYFTTTLDAKLDGYEAVLSKQKYIGGDIFTLADLFHLPYGALLPKAGYNYLQDTAKRPHLARWWKEISSRPTWEAVKDNVEA
ncbi:uncharacterized protein PHACADRAFT_257476 [Phanerochaete carnosa HHB-10118-sp]|uniref:glutathione transferase n=1 Tax=Phanerochaete carnosa (strain HHB-10118-sp) TaxID=650164 RepID=K5W4U1_PHACS|nr:uncharacterized protein PHACADRAFT_257476 [Phanerochaete carnosa HHB-10118-sp]EKM53959.1 hypothetical protein PHACADRAFT_257476 [Phanerochaete carnosa HHB-10118-sp]